MQKYKVNTDHFAEHVLVYLKHWNSVHVKNVMSRIPPYIQSVYISLYCSYIASLL